MMGRFFKHRVGALNGVRGMVRADPIPIGYYWLDVINGPSRIEGVSTEAHWAVWSTTWQNPRVGAPRVRVLKTVHHEAASGNPARDWVLFQVLSPVPRWTPETSLGLPTTAPKGAATNEGDTIQSPPREREWWEPSSGAPVALLVGAGVAIGIGLLVAVRR